VLDEGVDGGKLADYGLVLLVLVVEHLRVLEVFDQTAQSLQPGVRQLANLYSHTATFSLLNLHQRLLWKRW
jgi:hypothetical protein